MYALFLRAVYGTLSTSIHGSTGDFDPQRLAELKQLRGVLAADLAKHPAERVENTAWSGARHVVYIMRAPLNGVLYNARTIEWCFIYCAHH